jgi:hypothetical protein
LLLGLVPGGLGFGFPWGLPVPGFGFFGLLFPADGIPDPFDDKVNYL